MGSRGRAPGQRAPEAERFLALEYPKEAAFLADRCNATFGYYHNMSRLSVCDASEL